MVSQEQCGRLPWMILVWSNQYGVSHFSLDGAFSCSFRVCKKGFHGLLREGPSSLFMFSGWSSVSVASWIMYFVCPDFLARILVFETKCGDLSLCCAWPWLIKPNVSVYFYHHIAGRKLYCYQWHCYRSILITFGYHVMCQRKNYLKYSFKSPCVTVFGVIVPIWIYCFTHLHVTNC